MNGKKTYRYGPHNASQTDKWPSFVTSGSYGMWLWLCYSFNRHIATETQFWRVYIQSIHKVNLKKKRRRNPCHVGEWSTSCHSYFTPGKEPLYPLNRRFGWSQIRSEHFGEGKNLLPARNQTLDHTAYIHITVLVTLFQLSSSNICNCRLWGNIQIS